MHHSGASVPRGSKLVSIDVIACDKRKAFAQGSVSDEAIQVCFRKGPGLLRFARKDGRHDRGAERSACVGQRLHRPDAPQ
jgi:hypothetical protein